MEHGFQIKKEKDMGIFFWHINVSDWSQSTFAYLGKIMSAGINDHVGV